MIRSLSRHKRFCSRWFVPPDFKTTKPTNDHQERKTVGFTPISHKQLNPGTLYPRDFTSKTRRHRRQQDLQAGNNSSITFSFRFVLIRALGSIEAEAEVAFYWLKWIASVNGHSTRVERRECICSFCHTKKSWIVFWMHGSC